MNLEYKHISVIDIGKTNIKLVLIDGKTYKQLAVLSCPNTVETNGLYPHLNIKATWKFILRGLKHFNHKYSIDAISITTHGATAALISNDKLALPVLDYESILPETTRKNYDAIRGDFSETFSPKLPNGLNLGAQLFWQEEAFVEKFKQVTDILMYPQFWAWKLTGKKATEITSLGVHTDLWNPIKKNFSNLVDDKNWRLLFPPIAQATSSMGAVSKRLGKIIGSNKNIYVACGIHDSNASLFPYLNMFKDKFTVISSGTWTIAMNVGGDTNNLDKNRDSLANVNVFGNVVPTARFMGGREYDILTGDKKANPSKLDVDYIIKNQIYIIPSFSGCVGPFPNSKGRWIGEYQNLTKEKHSAAVSLYIALMTAECLKISGCSKIIVVEGPFTKNIFYASILSALINSSVYLSTDETGTSKGAALLLNKKTLKVNLGNMVKPYKNINLQSYANNWLNFTKNIIKKTTKV